jgi:predicted dehydrogenase
MRNRRQFIKESALAGIGLTLGLPAALAEHKIKMDDEIRVGVIGLDTSHSPAFAKYINDPQKMSMKGVSVTAAYPYGSTKIETSSERIPEYTQQFKDMGIKVVDSLDDLLKQTDCILLETNDGNLHYEQALAVMKAGKPMFIDKPLAANLVQSIKIIEANKKYKVPMFSSSSLRFLPQAQKIRNEHPIGDITGADAYSPEHLEPTHTDLYWYGIHGVEILYTLIGTGCKRLKRITTENTDMVVGEWDGGRIGTFRGDLQGKQFYGGMAYGTKGVMDAGSFDGYDLLVDKIVEFFRTKKPPVDMNETLEIYTFMQAADASRDKNGDWVDLKEVYDKAYKEAMG